MMIQQQQLGMEYFFDNILLKGQSVLIIPTVFISKLITLKKYVKLVIQNVIEIFWAIGSKICHVLHKV